MTSMTDEREEVVVHMPPPGNSVLYTKLDSKVHEYDVKKDEVPSLVDVGSLESYVKAEDQLKAMKKESLRDFYKRQNQAIEAYKVADQIKKTGLPEVAETESADADSYSGIAVKLSFYINVCLLIVKVFAAGWSSSLSLIASAIDSALDILSGAILYFTNRAINKHEPYKYPQGKSRLEPLGIMLFACAMGMCGLQVIVESVQEMIEGWTGTPKAIRIDALPIAVLATTIGLKACLFLLCTWMLSKVNSGSIETLRDDHRNDVLTNTCALAACIIASRIHYLWFFDPVGAVLLSIYIVFNWYHNGKSQIAFLIGRSAPSEFISQIVYLAAHHSNEILIVDTVLAYHYGVKYMVEVHIGLRGDMTLKEAHDVGEGLETQIEKLELVEKCFVHLDYEWQHKPEYQRRYKKEGEKTPEGSTRSLGPTDLMKAASTRVMSLFDNSKKSGRGSGQNTPIPDVAEETPKLVLAEPAEAIIKPPPEVEEEKASLV